MTANQVNNTLFRIYFYMNSCIDYTREKGKCQMSETLEELEHRYFMLEMQDSWDSSDYKYADELRERIKELKGEN